MKRYLSLTAVCLALGTALNSFASEPPAPSADSASTKVGAIKKVPDPQGGSISMYVGHYDETIEFPYGWTAKAELRGLTEVVYFHRKSHDDFGLHPFRPKKSDYKVENFGPMGLMQLLIIPKNAWRIEESQSDTKRQRKGVEAERRRLRDFR